MRGATGECVDDHMHVYEDGVVSGDGICGSAMFAATGGCIALSGGPCWTTPCTMTQTLHMSPPVVTSVVVSATSIVNQDNGFVWERVAVPHGRTRTLD